MLEIQQLLCMMIIFLFVSILIWKDDYIIHNLLGFGVFWLSIQNLVETNQIAFPLICAIFGLLVSIFSSIKYKKIRSKK